VAEVRWLLLLAGGTPRWGDERRGDNPASLISGYFFFFFFVAVFFAVFLAGIRATPLQRQESCSSIYQKS
jgi:hypothetical protein